MKKLLFILTMVACVFTASARDKYTHDVNVLPTAAQTTIKNNFKAQVSHIKVDKDWGRISKYDVVLNDGTEITFDSKGNWKDIEVRRNASVPAVFVPDAIATYIRHHQKDVTVTGIEKKKSGYEIELSNGVDMKFDSQCRFKGYDD